jgi:hypothetical protein
MNRARPSRMKRDREKARREKQLEKDARRAENKVRRANSPSGGGMDDSDLAEIRPGPQPKPWDDDEEEVV